MKKKLNNRKKSLLRWLVTLTPQLDVANYCEEIFFSSFLHMKMKVYIMDNTDCFTGALLSSLLQFNF